MKNPSKKKLAAMQENGDILFAIESTTEKIDENVIHKNLEIVVVGAMPDIARLITKSMYDSETVAKIITLAVDVYNEVSSFNVADLGIDKDLEESVFDKILEKVRDKMLASGEEVEFKRFLELIADEVKKHKEASEKQEQNNQ